MQSAIGVVTTTSSAETVAAVKTGIAVTSSIAKSKDVPPMPTACPGRFGCVAVTVDANGKIVKCAIDTAQTKSTSRPTEKSKHP
jgi:hypothetical protein